jgi:membrane protein YqaA with SNARE-associated domain
MNGVVSDGGEWLLVAPVTILVNAIPVFAPPTWVVMAYFHVARGLLVWPLAAVGAVTAAAGRGLLALGIRAGGERVVPATWRANTRALAAVIRARKMWSLPTLALFLLSPVPSGLFIAAGIGRAPLRPILACFAVGRFVSFVIWVSAADAAVASLRELLAPKLGAGMATTAQLAGLVVLIVVMRIDWARHLRLRLPGQQSSAT